MKRKPKKRACPKCHSRNTRFWNGKLRPDPEHPNDRHYLCRKHKLTCLDCGKVSVGTLYPDLLSSVFSIDVAKDQTTINTKKKATSFDLNNLLRKILGDI